MGDAVSFKGNKDGIVLMLDCSIDFELLCQMLVQKLWESRSFLGEHTALIVNSGEVCLEDGQRLAMKVLLQSLGHEVKKFLPEQHLSAEAERCKTKAALTEQTPSATASVQKEQLQAEKTSEQKTAIQPDLQEIEHYLAEGALVVRKNVRSGQKITYDGTLIVFGDVNAGAELIATGHILVLGTLRGVAHAGYPENKQAIVYATQLNSLQLRIADLIARAPDGESNERHMPEIARIIDNCLVIEAV